MLRDYAALESKAVSVRFMQFDEANAEFTMAALTTAIPIVSAFFELRSPLPRITTVLVPSRNEYDRLVVHMLGVPIETPSRPERIAQPQKTDLIALSPSAYGEHAATPFSRSSYRRLLAHELVHIVEELLSPDIEAIPQWWSEGLAVYVSGQWRWDKDFSQPVVDGVNEGHLPSIREIENDRMLGYQWGWTVIRHIEGRFGKGVILQIVAECADGDVLTRLRAREPSFEDQWRAALLKR
jgi:hypothetical protein